MMRTRARAGGWGVCYRVLVCSPPPPPRVGASVCFWGGGSGKLCQVVSGGVFGPPASPCRCGACARGVLAVEGPTPPNFRHIHRGSMLAGRPCARAGGLWTTKRSPVGMTPGPQFFRNHRKPTKPKMLYFGFLGKCNQEFGEPSKLWPCRGHPTSSAQDLAHRIFGAGSGLGARRGWK